MSSSSTCIKRKALSAVSWDEIRAGGSKTESKGSKSDLIRSLCWKSRLKCGLAEGGIMSKRLRCVRKNFITANKIQASRPVEKMTKRHTQGNGFCIFRTTIFYCTSPPPFPRRIVGTSNCIGNIYHYFIIMESCEAFSQGKGPKHFDAPNAL